MGKFELWLKKRKRKRGGFAQPPDRLSVGGGRRDIHKDGGGFKVSRGFMVFMCFLLAAIFFVHSFYRFDRQIVPLVLEATELEIQAKINNVINAVIQEIIMEYNISAADFIMATGLTTEEKPVLSVNTMLVNNICNVAAYAISKRLNTLDPLVVNVPLGMMFGLDTLAQLGPNFTFSMAPIGNAMVNHESSFTAVGINQTHFSVWLTIEAEVRVINPVHSTEIFVTRNISLVDTIISGVVPDMYLHMDTPPVIGLN